MRFVTGTVSLIGLAAATASFAISSYYSRPTTSVAPDTFNVRQRTETLVDFSCARAYDVVSEDGFTVAADRPGAGYPSISDRRTVEPQRGACFYLYVYISTVSQLQQGFFSHVLLLFYFLAGLRTDTVITVVTGASAKVISKAVSAHRRLSNDDDGDGFEDDYTDQFNDDSNWEITDDADEYAVDDDKIASSMKAAKQPKNKGVQVTHCDWKVELLRGGGVYDEMPTFGSVAARDWLPTGRVTRSMEETASLMEFTLQFPSPGSYKVSLECHFDDQTVVAFDDDVDAYYVRRELRDLKLEVRPFNGRRTPNERTYQPPKRNIYRFPETHAALYTT